MRINKEDIKNNRFIRHFYYYTRGTVQRNHLRQQANETLEQFEIKVYSEEENENIINDMIKMNMRYGYGFDEYLYFNFKEKNIKERLSFVADWEHLGYTCTMNNSQNAEIFDNKWKTFQKYKDYYHREVLFIEGQNFLNEFCSFLSRHKKAVVKPIDESCGKGVSFIKLRETLEENHHMFKKVLSENKGRFLIEEPIAQAYEMSKLHPASVNTIRVTTVRLDNEVLIVHPFMRIGQHGNHVDNGGAGGIMCPIDVKSGRIIAAADEFGRKYIVHPDSKEKIIGFSIPQWGDLIHLAEKLASIVPDNRYTGWDLALADDGWLMVEANRRGQFVGWQIPTQIGFRKEINDILKLQGKRY